MKCQNCGWENENENKNCSICGAEISIQQDFKPYPPRKKGKKEFKILKRRKEIVDKVPIFFNRTSEIFYNISKISCIIIFGFLPSMVQYLQKRKRIGKYFFYTFLVLIFLMALTYKYNINNLFLFLLITLSITSSFDATLFYLKNLGFKMSFKNFTGLALTCISLFFLSYNIFLFTISFLILIAKVERDYNYIFKEGDRVLVFRRFYFYNEPKRGDIALIKHPQYGSTIERLFGTPGDLIELKDGKIFVNGEKLQQEYIPLSAIPNFHYSVKLRDDQYCVLIYRPDYRDLIILNRDMLKGKAKIIVYPPERRKILK